MKGFGCLHTQVLLLSHDFADTCISLQAANENCYLFLYAVWNTMYFQDIPQNLHWICSGYSVCLLIWCRHILKEKHTIGPIDKADVCSFNKTGM